jgi:uncharacterized membrane protein YeiH
MNGILEWFTLAGVAVFAVSGALLGLRKQMDIIGVAFLATVTGIGGGTVRDVLIGATPVGWVRDPTVVAICIGCAIAISPFNAWLLGQRMRWLLYADAVGLSLFSVLGASTAESAGAHPLVCVLFGAMTATFGGIIRDIVASETPILFRREIYVTATLAGAFIYIVLPQSWPFILRAPPGISVALAMRLLALRFNWSLPFPRYRNTESLD